MKTMAVASNRFKGDCGVKETVGCFAASYPGQLALSELPEEAWNQVR